VDAYQGSTFASLQSLNIGWNPQTFHADAGVTYYLAAGGYGFIFTEPASFHLELQPDPNAPSNPSVLIASSPLQIFLAGQNLKLIWPADNSGRLEYSTSLANGTKWLPLTNAVTVEAGHKVISLPLESGSKFFRLR